MQREGVQIAPVAALYADHHAWLCSWLRRRLGNHADAADLAQDTFVRVIGRPHCVDELHPCASLREPRAWLATIAHGLVVDHVRREVLRRAYEESLVGLPEALHPGPESRALLLETLTSIDAMLDGLGPKVRAAFLMSRLEGLGYAQIAVQLGVSLSSVEKYMATALRHCLALRTTAPGPRVAP